MTKLSAVSRLGTTIPPEARGVLYLCKYNFKTYEIKVEREIFFANAVDALQAYANIPNPESQLATGKTYRDLLEEVSKLHANLDSEKWRKELANYL